jgi:hypothetical protein
LAKSKKELKNLIAFYERNMINAGLAPTDEIEKIAEQRRGARDKDSLWDWLAELKSLARARKALEQKRGSPVKADAYEAAIAALEGRAESVWLPSLDTSVKVVPASWARILIVEDCEYWILKLHAYEIFIKQQEEQSDDHPQILDRVITSINETRSLLYAQIAAPTPAPVEEGIDWADKITVLEEMALKQAWHRVNLDLIARLPEPASRDGKRALPRHWSFVFQSYSWRERRPPGEIIRDRSLASIVAATVLEVIKSEKEGKAFMGDPDDVAEALGIDA